MKEAIKREIAALKAHWAGMPVALKIGAPVLFGGIVLAVAISIVSKL